MDNHHHDNYMNRKTVDRSFVSSAICIAMQNQWRIAIILFLFKTRTFAYLLGKLYGCVVHRVCVYAVKWRYLFSVAVWPTWTPLQLRIISNVLSRSIKGAGLVALCDKHKSLTSRGLLQSFSGPCQPSTHTHVIYARGRKVNIYYSRRWQCRRLLARLPPPLSSRSSAMFVYSRRWLALARWTVTADVVF